MILRGLKIANIDQSGEWPGLGEKIKVPPVPFGSAKSYYPFVKLFSVGFHKDGQSQKYRPEWRMAWTWSLSLSIGQSAGLAVSWSEDLRI